MATFNEKDVTLLYTGKSSATAQTTGSIDNLGDGEIGIFDASGTARLTAAGSAAGDDFRLVQGRGTEAPIVGKKISGSSIKSVTISQPFAATEQVAYIGYDGATAASQIDVIASNLYYVRAYADQSLTSNHGGQYVKHAVYESPATGATELSIAEGLVANGNLNMSREAEKFMRYDVVLDPTPVAAFDFDNAVTTVNGSKVISIAAAITYNTGTPVVVGDYIRLSNDGVAVVATTSEVYRVTAVDAVNFLVTLDRPFLGDSNVMGSGVSLHEVIPNATAIAAQAGVKVQGQPLKWSLGKFNFRKAKFDISLEDFGTTPFVNTVGAPGVGTYEQAAELEWFYRGNNGEYFRAGQPNIYDGILDVANEPYAVVTIVAEEEGGYTTKNRRDFVFKMLIPAAIGGVTPCVWAKNGTANGVLNVVDVIAASAVSASLT